jgi:hypothetical protein
MVLINSKSQSLQISKKMISKEIVSTTILVSRAYDDIATSLFGKASKALKKGEITYVHYQQIYENFYRPLIGYSFKMVLDETRDIMNGLEEQFKDIEYNTLQLKERVEKIESIQKVIGVISSVLSTAALIATFIAVPNPTSALSAISSIGALIEGLKNDEDNSAAADEA